MLLMMGNNVVAEGTIKGMQKVAKTTPNTFPMIERLIGGVDILRELKLGSE